MLKSRMVPVLVLMGLLSACAMAPKADQRNVASVTEKSCYTFEGSSESSLGSPATGDVNLEIEKLAGAQTQLHVSYGKFSEASGVCTGQGFLECELSQGKVHVGLAEDGAIDTATFVESDALPLIQADRETLTPISCVQ